MCVQQMDAVDCTLIHIMLMTLLVLPQYEDQEGKRQGKSQVNPGKG